MGLENWNLQSHPHPPPRVGEEGLEIEFNHTNGQSCLCYKVIYKKSYQSCLCYKASIKTQRARVLRAARLGNPRRCWETDRPGEGWAAPDACPVSGPMPVFHLAVSEFYNKPCLINQ